MLARFVQLALVLELAAYAVIGAWIHSRAGWSVPALLIAAIGFAGAIRLTLVCATMAYSGVRAGPRLIVEEWFAMLADNFFYLPFERYAVRPDPQASPGGRIPVILVHGYFSNRGYFRWLLAWLESHGIAPIFTPNFASALATIEQFTEQLHGAIEGVVRATGQPKVVLVCHSMGGLAARVYLDSYGFARVAKLITIASPHGGTLMARFGLGANARQMRRGSRFLEELRTREANRGWACPVTSIYTTDDNLVSPHDTSRLPRARNVALSGHGHVGVLHSERMFRVLLEELREAGVIS